MTIRLFVIGGTFDKEHDPITESLVFNETHVPALLQCSRSFVDVKISKIRTSHRRA